MASSHPAVEIEQECTELLERLAEVLGYVTATLASFFIDRDAERADAPLAGAAALHALAEEVRLRRVEIRDLGAARDRS